MKAKLILADPPWQYVNRSPTHGLVTYDMMKDMDLFGLRCWIDSHTEKNCLLVMWATYPKLPTAIKLVSEWGFEYVTAFPWIKVEEISTTVNGLKYKPSFGCGYWARSCSELIIIARKGHVKAPKDVMLGLLAPRAEHSRKPDSIYQYCESISKGPYIEMFARRIREGWTTYGNEIGTTIGGAERVES